MDKFDVAGILQAYAIKVGRARNEKQLKNFIRELKKELDLRKVKWSDENG